MITTIWLRKGNYLLTEADQDESIESTSRSKRYLRRTSGGIEYIENEKY